MTLLPLLSMSFTDRSIFRTGPTLQVRRRLCEREVCASNVLDPISGTGCPDAALYVVPARESAVSRIGICVHISLGMMVTPAPESTDASISSYTSVLFTLISSLWA